MLSSSFNIKEFIEKAKGHTYLDIIWMADQEATAAERCFYKLGCKGDSDKMMYYSRCLKDFILYMRHGVRTQKIRNLQLNAFQKIRLDH